MISVCDLHYDYRSQHGETRIVVLEGVSLEVAPGHCLAVTGASGNGKSTLCLAVAGLAPRLTHGRWAGTLRIADRDPQAEPPGALADVLGIVMQDPAGQVFNPTVAEEIAWGLGNLGIPRAAMPPRIEQALALVGLEHLPWDQHPRTLSGGEQKRLALAAALALSPRVLILDEPSGGLSPLGRSEMAAVLRRLRTESQLAILLAESDPSVIAALADEVALLSEGRFVHQAPPRAFYASLDPASHPGVALPLGLHFARSLTQMGGPAISPLSATEAAEQVRAWQAARRPSGTRITEATEPSGANMPASHEPALEVTDLTFAYSPARPVLHNLSLQIPRGQFAALTGENGAGKTTLARHLIGLLRPSAGEVRVLGQEIAPLSVGQIARMVGFAYQNPELQIFNATVREEIAFGPSNLGLHGAALNAAVETAMARFDLLALAEQAPAALSFSARRRVALASVAAMQTLILVLDEPTVGLDALGQAMVLNWLAERHRAGAAILLITHDMEIAAAHAERIIVLDQGRIVADGPPREVFRQREVLARAGLEPPFAVQLADALPLADLPAELTPLGAARTVVAGST